MNKEIIIQKIKNNNEKISISSLASKVAYFWFSAIRENIKWTKWWECYCIYCWEKYLLTWRPIQKEFKTEPKGFLVLLWCFIPRKWIILCSTNKSKECFDSDEVVSKLLKKKKKIRAEIIELVLRVKEFWLVKLLEVMMVLFRFFIPRSSLYRF
nr:hypothetical protein [Entomoplasma sp. MP1]